MGKLHSDAVRFFRAHAGFNYGKGETAEQGRERCARALADAERDGTALGFTIEWAREDCPDTSWIDNEDDREHARMMQACVYDANGTPLALLGGIHEDTRDEKGALRYRRVVRAELFAEALSVVAAEGGAR